MVSEPPRELVTTALICHRMGGVPPVGKLDSTYALPAVRSLGSLYTSCQPPAKTTKFAGQVTVATVNPPWPQPVEELLAPHEVHPHVTGKPTAI